MIDVERSDNFLLLFIEEFQYKRIEKFIEKTSR